MNKNLKKVISTVAALAISASTVVGFAANFSDVPADASYAQAVSELSALGIISGYEDGTFGPDKQVTRAEITKMIVDAIGSGSQAASGTGIDTQFSDVTGSHWAAGYVATGVADGFISGMGDGTFAPDANVTFVQAQSMLVRAIGYETYAQGSGGWPNGYKTWAATRGIIDGVSANDSDALTRAQVAQMISNAMDAPVCVIEKYEPDAWGNQKPVLAIMDGEGKGYQTLYTKKHDAYKVFGRVVATSKTDESIETDMVLFRVEKADNFDDEYIKAATAVEEEMYVGDSGAAEYVRTYAEALIQKNEDDEYTIISITPAAANKTVTLLAEDIDESKTNDLAEDALYFYPAGSTRGSIKYKLESDAILYVNGMEVGTFDVDAYNRYIVGNPSNMVTLQKETEVGSSISGNYNVVMITTYATAVVDQVIEKTDAYTVTFKENSSDASARMKVLKDEEETYTYNFTLDGAEIAVTDLQENDVLSISYNEADFAGSYFYDVQVSRNTVADVRCTGVSSAKNEYTIGGEKYSIASNMSIAPETSAIYTIYLDVFGRIAYMEESDSSTNLGILSNVYQKANGDYVAELITKEGTVAEYKMDDEEGALYAAAGDGVASEVYPQWVVDYKVSTSTNKLTVKEVLADYKAEVNGAYNANSNKIGGIRMSDSTVVLDLSDIDAKETVRVVSMDSLVDDSTYTAYGYDKSTTDNTYRFVIITSGFGGITADSQLAVFVESEMVTVDGDDMDAMKVLVNGEEQTIIIDEDATSIDVADYAEGDVIVFAVNASNYMTDVMAIFNADSMGMLDGSATFADWAADYAYGANVLAADLTDALSKNSDDPVDVIFGVTTDKLNNSLYVNTINSDENGYYVDLEEDCALTMTDNTKVYTYNFDISKKKGSRVVLDEGIMETPTNYKDAYKDGNDENSEYYIDNEMVADEVVFTVVRTLDGDEALEVYQIVASN